MVKKLIGGKFYIRDESAFSKDKKRMQKYIAKVRRKGYLARIVKEGDVWQAYYKETDRSRKLEKKKAKGKK